MPPTRARRGPGPGVKKPGWTQKSTPKIEKLAQKQFPQTVTAKFSSKSSTSDSKHLTSGQLTTQITIDLNDKKYQAELTRRTAIEYAPQVHQESISAVEKLLLLFDKTAEFGPCAGIKRIDRWRRAKKLDLAPPEYIYTLLNDTTIMNEPKFGLSYLDLHEA